MKFFLKLNIKNGWIEKKNKESLFCFKGYLNNLSINDLYSKLFLLNFNTNDISKFFRKLDGHFSIIFIQKDKLLLGNDRVSSNPVILVKEKNNVYIADNYLNLLSMVKKKNLSFNSIQLKHLAMSGFTFGQSGIYNEVLISSPGTFCLVKNKLLINQKYHDWKPFKKVKGKPYLIKSKLKNINNNIIFKLIKSCNNRCIVIPLSAGYDSRFILSGLVEKGYKNLITFSYGRKENREKNIAEKLAKYLNIPWRYIEFTNYNQKKMAISKIYDGYKKFSDTTQSVHFPQDFHAIYYLRENKIIPKDSIIVNGQSGDFISGNHIPELDSKYGFEEILNYYFLKHYKIWNSLMNQNKAIIKKKIIKRILDFKPYNSKINKKFLLEAFQKLEYEDRQTKYVIHGQRTYEYFGYEWRLPMWDKDYINFWEKIDTSYKMRQSLYREVLLEQNWGDVWKKFPLNPPNTFSTKWQIIRFLLKCFFIPYGKNKWHAFEKKYLDYFINPLCEYAQWKYLKVLREDRGFANSLSFRIEEYLKEKGSDWKGMI